MSARHVLTAGFLVAMVMIVLSILIAATQPSPDPGQLPIVTIKSCPATCEMLV